jgi:hypothetical protein
LTFLKDKADQVSGFKREIQDAYGLFVSRLRDERPGLLEEGLRQLADKKRRWDDVVADDGDSEDQPQKKTAGFSFGFGFGDDDDDDDEIP